jgi:FAD/FMN-containing dehydrogenase
MPQARLSAWTCLSIVGSEGTFVIVTEITVRLLRPHAVKTLLTSFHSIEAAASLFPDVIAGELFHRQQFVDAKTIEAVKLRFTKPVIHSMLLPLC